MFLVVEGIHVNYVMLVLFIMTLLDAFMVILKGKEDASGRIRPS